MKNHHQRAILMNDIMHRAKPSAGVRLNDPVKLREEMAISDLRYKEPDINSTLKWNNPNNMERNINPVLQPGAHKKTPVTDADGHILGYNIQYRKNASSKQTQLAFGPNQGKVMNTSKRGKGLGTSTDPVVFT